MHPFSRYSIQGMGKLIHHALHPDFCLNARDHALFGAGGSVSGRSGRPGRDFVYRGWKPLLQV